MFIFHFTFVTCHYRPDTVSANDTMVNVIWKMENGLSDQHLIGVIQFLSDIFRQRDAANRTVIQRVAVEEDFDQRGRPDAPLNEGLRERVFDVFLESAAQGARA